MFSPFGNLFLGVLALNYLHCSLHFTPRWVTLSICSIFQNLCFLSVPRYSARFHRLAYRALGLEGWRLYPKGPCTQNSVFGPNVPIQGLLSGQYIYTIWVHGPLYPIKPLKEPLQESLKEPLKEQCIYYMGTWTLRVNVWWVSSSGLRQTLNPKP